MWKGDFAAQLLRATQPAELHLIDPWKFEPAPDYARAWYGGAWAKSQADMDRVHQHVVSRFAAEIAAGVVRVHRGSSTEAHAEFSAEYFDWVYIDGNHLYDYVRQDLANFAPKVKPGGILCGDDYGVAGWWRNGVQQAVDEFARTSNFDFLGVRSGQFVLRKRAAAKEAG